MLASVTCSDVSIPRWHARQALLALRCARMSPGSDKYVFRSIAAAIKGATFPSFKCCAWLKCVSGVGRAARIDLLWWHGLHAAATGSRFSCADVLEAAAAWQSTHSRLSCKCSLWENCWPESAPTNRDNSNNRFGPRRSPTLCMTLSRSSCRRHPRPAGCRRSSGTQLQAAPIHPGSPGR